VGGQPQRIDVKFLRRRGKRSLKELGDKNDPPCFFGPMDQQPPHATLETFLADAERLVRSPPAAGTDNSALRGDEIDDATVGRYTNEEAPASLPTEPKKPSARGIGPPTARPGRALGSPAISEAYEEVSSPPCTEGAAPLCAATSSCKRALRSAEIGADLCAASQLPPRATPSENLSIWDARSDDMGWRRLEEDDNSEVDGEYVLIWMGDGGGAPLPRPGNPERSVGLPQRRATVKETWRS
jgi:hypothetical protein